MREVKAGRGSRRTAQTTARSARSVAALVILLAAAGCQPPEPPRMIVYNANPGPVTVGIGGHDGRDSYAIAGCATARFVWDYGWSAESGADPGAAPGAPRIEIYSTQGVETPVSFYEVIQGTKLAEHVGTTTPPSLPPCSAVSPGGSD